MVLQERYRASERLACRVVGQHRSTQRQIGKVVSIEEAKLRHRLREIAADHIRWGRRMAYRLLRREGWTVNHKRVQRLWREEGLQRPTPRKRKRARPADGSVRRHRAEHPHQVWAMDFQFDATDVDPENRSRVNESPQPARLGRGFHHESHQTHRRADHPQALARRASAKQWTAEQLIAQGRTVADVCRVIEMTQPTYHRWRQQYGGMQAEEARRLTQLEKEKARLKKLLPEAELEKSSADTLIRVALLWRCG